MNIPIAITEPHPAQSRLLSLYADCRYGDGLRRYTSAELNTFADEADRAGLVTFGLEFERFALQVEQAEEREQNDSLRCELELQRSIRNTY